MYCASVGKYALCTSLNVIPTRLGSSFSDPLLLLFNLFIVPSEIRAARHPRYKLIWFPTIMEPDDRLTPAAAARATAASAAAPAACLAGARRAQVAGALREEDRKLAECALAFTVLARDRRVCFAHQA
jgi:hypothetical protein